MRKRLPSVSKLRLRIPTPPIVAYMSTGYVAAVQSHSQHKAGPALHDARHVVLRRQFSLQMIATMSSLHPLSDLFLRLGKAMRDTSVTPQMNGEKQVEPIAKAHVDVGQCSGFRKIMRALDGLSARNETHATLRQDDTNATVISQKSPFVKVSEFASLLSNHLHINLTPSELLLIQRFYGHATLLPSSPRRKLSSTENGQVASGDNIIDGIMNYAVAMGAVLTARPQVGMYMYSRLRYDSKHVSVDM